MKIEQSENAQPRSEPRLAAVLGPWSAGALVVGTVIGSGIFMKPSQVAQSVGDNLLLIMALWVVCGVVNLFGALTLSELSAMMPHAGGTYIFLREAYGRACAFLWAWAEFWVIRSGSIAALAAAMALSAAPLLQKFGWEVPEGSRLLLERSVAISAIVFLAALNVVGTRWGGRVQNVTTAIKIGSVVFLAMLPVLAIFYTPQDTPDELLSGESFELLGLGSALAAIMWAYDGWGSLTVVAEEIRQPQRNVPKALAGGVILLMVLYFGANLAFHWVLPWKTIIHSNIAAMDASETLLPHVGGTLVLSMLMVSLFGALNSNILVGPRVLFALARDHKPLGILKRIDPRTGTPALSIICLSAWSVALILLGDWLAAIDLGGWLPTSKKTLFDILTNYCIFGGSLFYLLAVASVFVFRITKPNAPRPYRTWGYPLVPLAFVSSYIFFLYLMLQHTRKESVIGLGLIALGLPVFYLLEKVSQRGEQEKGE